MKKTIGLVLCLIGCSPHRYSLMDIQQYNQAMMIAESRGVDTTSMHVHLVDMLVSYSKNPGKDPYAEAMKEEADAAVLGSAGIFYQATKPEPQQMPMSPGEFKRRGF